MGNNVNATLFYGFNYHNEEGDYEQSEELQEFLEEGGDLEELYAEKKGLVKPYKDNNDYDFENDGGVARKYFSDSRKLWKDSGVEINTSCCGDYATWYIHIYNKSADRSESEEVNFKELQSRITAEKIKKLKEFCGVVGLKYQEPKWTLTAYSDY